MSHTLAKVISLVLQPLLMPFFGVLAIFYFHPLYHGVFSSKPVFYFLAFVFVITFALPALGAIIMKSMGIITSLEMPTKEERKLPILFTAVIYSVGYFMLMKMPNIDEIKVFLMATTGCIIISGVITNFYKISIHMMGIGGFVGLLAWMDSFSIFDITLLLALVLVLAGLVGMARIQLKAHTTTQLYLGFLFGVAAVFLCGKFLV